jgi:hypothetical protein
MQTVREPSARCWQPAHSAGFFANMFAMYIYKSRQDRIREYQDNRIDARLRSSRDIRGIDQDLTSRRPGPGAEIISSATGLLNTRRHGRRE